MAKKDTCVGCGKKLDKGHVVTVSYQSHDYTEGWDKLRYLPSFFEVCGKCWGEMYCKLLEQGRRGQRAGADSLTTTYSTTPDTACQYDRASDQPDVVHKLV